MQKAIIQVPWEAGKTQEEINAEVRCSQSAVAKITK